MRPAPGSDHPAQETLTRPASQLWVSALNFSPLVGVVYDNRAEMVSRAADWFKQAERDLGQAADSRRAGRHEWACFAAHQAAEKAAKALHLHLGQEAWGHVVAKLLRDLPASAAVAAGPIEQGQVLDTFYIPSRCPNSHPEGAPFEHYGPLQSEEALRFAGAIIEFVRRRLA